MPARGVVTLPWSGESWPGRVQDGIPTFAFRCAPPGLATRRQLRARGLCPGGQDYVAQLVWRRGRRWAALYRLDLARPSRTRTGAQRAAPERAMAAPPPRPTRRGYGWGFPPVPGSPPWRPR